MGPPLETFECFSLCLSRGSGLDRRCAEDILTIVYSEIGLFSSLVTRNISVAETRKLANLHI